MPSEDAACLSIIIALASEVSVRKRKKRKQRVWMKDWLRKRSLFSHANLLKELQLSSSIDYKNYLRMDPTNFNELLEMVTPLIQKEDTIMRDAISPKQRLFATLRYLASGLTFEGLKFETAIAAQTLGKIIIETCEAIIKVLKKHIKDARMAKKDGDTPEIVRLQLRKPTRWGWELSTYKSSPSITMPTIQLYDYKGRLLIEAADNGQKDKTWRSFTKDGENENRNNTASKGMHLGRSKSDTLNRNITIDVGSNKFQSIDRRKRNKRGDDEVKSPGGGLDGPKSKSGMGQGRKSEETSKVVVEGRRYPYGSLKKSRSDGSQHKENVHSKPYVYHRNSFQTFQELVQRYERGSRSGEEMLKRRLRSSEESVKRAEEDGFLGLITPNIPPKEKPNKGKKQLQIAETVVVDNSPSRVTISDCKAKKYTTRTSSAGTLVISEDSFSDTHRRRRRRDGLGATPEEEKIVDVSERERNSGGSQESERFKDRIQRLSNPTSPVSGKCAFNPQMKMAVGAVKKYGSEKQLTPDFNNVRSEVSNEAQKNCFNKSQNSSNSGRPVYFPKNLRNVSDPTSISKKYAFNRNLDDRSHSTETLAKHHTHRSTNTNADTKSTTNSTRQKTEYVKNNRGLESKTNSLGFTRFIRPLSDPTSWMSRRHAFSQNQQVENNDQEKLSSNSPRKEVYLETVKPSRHGSDPTNFIPQRHLYGKNSNVSRIGNAYLKSDTLPKNVDIDTSNTSKRSRHSSDPTNLMPQEHLYRLNYNVSRMGNADLNSNGLAKNVDTDTSMILNHSRHSSDPTNLIPQKHSCSQNSNVIRMGNDHLNRRTPWTSSRRMEADGLFHSRSEVFPFRGYPPTDKINDGSDNYTVQEPVTPASTPGENPKNSGPIIETWRGEGSRRTSGDGPSTCGSVVEEEGPTKGHVIKDHPSHHRDSGAGSDLLQLVRRLSSTADNVKMGANVSRHSAKGLSGRRSQSSGSICNGKGRHPEGKICSSLPSYLDDRQPNGCNNNHHDCEKQPLDEVDRIPPLGDGAPLHWKFSDTQTALCDQGYGSERSPEEEYPPPLPDHDQQCHHHLEPHACYPFITPESTFIVKLTKGTRGLGLSVTGGIDSTGSWPGLIRIKRLFPHQPASACGLLNVGDLLLQANGITLTGLTNYEALEVLRTASNQVDLKVCRPPPDVLNCVSPISEVPPPPPRREPPCTLNLSSAIYTTPEDDYYHGEFEVTLKKIHGSLGFTLRKEDDSALGHYVRALVREPALTDGRIKAGDKIIAVNDVEISPMSHEQAVQFLRQCPEVVRLRLYRDSAQTPVAALSPSETTPRTSFSRKAHLRQEAVDMLNDLAVRKLIPGNQDTFRRSLSPNASPRRLRRQNCPSDASQMTDSSTKYLISDEQFHEGLLQKCSHPFDDDAFNSLFSIESDDGDRPHRPSSLDLYNPNQTPVAARKPRFNFSLAHNAYELNNLDPEVLDAPNLTYNLGNDDVKITDTEVGNGFLQEPASMPHIPVENPTFSYKNPAYQSAHPQISSDTVDSASTVKTNGKSDDASLKKWKSEALQDETDSRSERDDHRMHMKEEYEVLAIELNRGWNSRLGFSLQGAAGVTYVSAVHADSVAAKDGRLKPGDRIIKVNDESVEHMTTAEIIDLLRIVRGPVCIVVSRVKSTEDCPKSNAEN